MYTVKLFLEDELDPQTYTDVKHIWWQAGNSVLTLLQYLPDGSHRYVSWKRETIRWYESVPKNLDPLLEIGDRSV